MKGRRTTRLWTMHASWMQPGNHENTSTVASSMEKHHSSCHGAPCGNETMMSRDSRLWAGPKFFSPCFAEKNRVFGYGARRVSFFFFFPLTKTLFRRPCFVFPSSSSFFSGCVLLCRVQEQFVCVFIILMFYLYAFCLFLCVFFAFVGPGNLFGFRPCFMRFLCLCVLKGLGKRMKKKNCAHACMFCCVFSPGPNLI